MQYSLKNILSNRFRRNQLQRFLVARRLFQLFTRHERSRSHDRARVIDELRRFFPHQTLEQLVAGFKVITDDQRKQAEKIIKKQDKPKKLKVKVKQPKKGKKHAKKEK